MVLHAEQCRHRLHRKQLEDVIKKRKWKVKKNVHMSINGWNIVGFDQMDLKKPDFWFLF